MLYTHEGRDEDGIKDTDKEKLGRWTKTQNKERNRQTSVDVSGDRGVCNLLNKSDAQTEDGHAMMKSDTFHSFRNLSQRVCVGMFALRNTCAKDTSDRELCAHAVRGCRNNCRQMRANVKTHVCVSPKTGREVVSCVRSCRGKL